mgnify:CR=1 FL=1
MQSDANSDAPMPTQSTITSETPVEDPRETILTSLVLLVHNSCHYYSIDHCVSKATLATHNSH